MTMPNQPAPEGSQQVGSQWGQQDRGLTVEQAKARIRGEVGGTFGGLGTLFQDILQGIVGFVQGIGSAVIGFFESIGNFFFQAKQDMSHMDQARVDAELAVVDNMSSSLEMLDEVQRFGGAYNDYPRFNFVNGEVTPHVLPLSNGLAMSPGSRWVPPYTPLTHSEHHNYPNDAYSQGKLAAGSGFLELTEEGLWLIFFQAGVLQGNAYVTRPSDVWCYVTPADTSIMPIGAPGFGLNEQPAPGLVYGRSKYGSTVQETMAIEDLKAYGRAASYIGERNAYYGGGNTVFGMVPAILPEGAWKVTMSTASWALFGGGMATTYVAAYKVSSESLREDIDELKSQLASALPGQAVNFDLDEAAIQQMIDESKEVGLDYEVGN